MNVPFIIPEITEEDIESVCEVLRSGWITTGPKTEQFEKLLQSYIGVDAVKCVSSATAGLEVVLKTIGVGIGDEVITTPYTYTASASPAIHLGARIIFADVSDNSYHISIEEILKKINDKTKVIIPMDYAGVPFDYRLLREELKKIGRSDIFIIADSAHSLGSKFNDKYIGSQADIHIFSFQAVKNLTTAEGGAISFNKSFKLGKDFFKRLQLNVLQGQDKSSLRKMNGDWEYDILTDGMKCNMTDITAALGVGKLQRYSKTLIKRKEALSHYAKYLGNARGISLLKHNSEFYESSYHLCIVNINGFTDVMRNELIRQMKLEGIICNVHYKPLPMMTYYKNMGYSIFDYPNSKKMYDTTISLHLYNTITEKEIECVCKTLIRTVEKINSELV